MNRSDFISYIQHPEKLSGENTANLSGLIRDFPYFQTAHLLYTKNLYDQNSIHYNEQLKVAAAYSGDRRILYNLIHSKNKPLSVAGEKEALIQKLAEKQGEKAVKEPLIEAKQQRRSDVELEKEIMNEVISSYIEIEVDHELQEIEREEVPSTGENKESGDKNESLNFAGKYSFSDWLRIKGRPAIQEEAKEGRSADDLVDKFIAEEPRISKPQAEFFSPVNLARKSVIDDDHMVTETLARIYAAQGHHSKAIKTYEALSLKYPEKSTSFAARIKELKNKLIG